MLKLSENHYGALPAQSAILEQQQFHLVPRMQQQEFIGNATDNPYWEGACWVYDKAGMRIGKAYLELAGYGGDMGKLIH